MQNARKSRRTVIVWDPLVRIFHWSLAAFFFTAYLTEDDLLSVHVYAGYAVAGLVAFRIVWGIIGTRHARFSDFVTGPGDVMRYLGRLFTGRPRHYIGHNPAGAAMVIFLLISLAATTFTGMVVLASEGGGPLAGTMFATLSEESFEEVHEFLANFTLFLVALHVAGVLVSSFLHRENLVRAMISGRKELDPQPNDTQLPSGTADGMSGKIS
jgi:cytochrome b